MSAGDPARPGRRRTILISLLILLVLFLCWYKLPIRLSGFEDPGRASVEIELNGVPYPAESLTQEQKDAVLRWVKAQRFQRAFGFEFGFQGALYSDHMIDLKISEETPALHRIYLTASTLHPEDNRVLLYGLSPLSGRGCLLLHPKSSIEELQSILGTELP